MSNQTGTAPAVGSSAWLGSWVLCAELQPPDMQSVLVISHHGKQVVMHRERGVWVQGVTVAGWVPSHWTNLPPPPNEHGLANWKAIADDLDAALERLDTLYRSTQAPDAPMTRPEWLRHPWQRYHRSLADSPNS